MPAGADQSAVPGDITRCLQDWRGGGQDALANGITTSYAYDALNRMSTRSYSDGKTPTVTNTYDSAAGAPLVRAAQAATTWGG